MVFGEPSFLSLMLYYLLYACSFVFAPYFKLNPIKMRVSWHFNLSINKTSHPEICYSTREEKYNRSKFNKYHQILLSRTKKGVRSYYIYNILVSTRFMSST